MATLNALMKHLRSSGVAIGGSAQKRRLKNLGYYHGYKGYRFAGSANNRLSFGDFSEVEALNDYDMQLKTLLYPKLMQIESALKNYTLEAVLTHAGSARFEDVWSRSLTSYRHANGKQRTAEWDKRLRLKQEVDATIYRNRQKDVIRHFWMDDKDIPIWALFEIITLGNFGNFLACLDPAVKGVVTADLKMPTNVDAARILVSIIFLLKDLRNAVAHNGAVFDVRFRSGRVSQELVLMLEKETGVSGISFGSITDYVLLVVYLLRAMGFSKTECRRFVNAFRAATETLRATVPAAIFLKIIRTDNRRKINAILGYIKQC